MLQMEQKYYKQAGLAISLSMMGQGYNIAR